MALTWCGLVAPCGACAACSDAAGDAGVAGAACGGCGACDICTRRVAEWDPRVIGGTILAYIERRPQIPLWCGGVCPRRSCVLCKDAVMLPAARAAGIGVACAECGLSSVVHLFTCSAARDWRLATYHVFQQ
jgi:hypothetical protein